MPSNEELLAALLRVSTSPEMIGYRIGLDLSAQLLAMESLLGRNQEADEKLRLKINNLYKRAQQATYEPGSFEEANQDGGWLNLQDVGSYQSAAHSMAAVAMLAPFAEMLFVRIFQNIREKQLAPQADCDEKRRQASEEQFWDPHWFFQPKKRPRKDLPEGTKQLADYSGLAEFLPGDYYKTVKALLCYRNAMFHNGLEWPEEGFKKFQETMQ